MRGESGFSTTVYRKPTATGVYTRWESFGPTSQKIALIRSLVSRAMKICSPHHLHDEITKLKKIFQANGYPLPIIDLVVNQALHPEPNVFGPKLKPIFIRLPWLGAPSLAIKNRLQHATKKAIPWCRAVCSFPSKTAFNTSKKDVLPAESISNVIYLFKCDCSHTYVGRTSQRLEERINQHVPRVLVESACPIAKSSQPIKRKRGRPRKDDSATCALQPAKADTAITRHLKESPTCLSEVGKKVPSHFSVLAKGRSLLQLQYLEALFITSYRPSLCVQKEHVVTLALF